MLSLSNEIIFIFIISVSAFIVDLLAPILTPFMLGALLAYLSNPLVKKFEQWRIPHLLSVTSVFIIIFAIFTLLISMLIPLIQSQTIVFLDIFPQIIAWLQKTVLPQLHEYLNADTVKKALSAKSGLIFTTVLQSGTTLMEWIINIVLIRIFSFYMLRYLDLILKNLKESLPKFTKPTILQLAKQCDEILSAFVLGQLLVMLGVSCIYAIGLSLIGLKSGFIIGLLGGVLSIVPYLGSIFVVLMGCITALIQFNEWQPVI